MDKVYYLQYTGMSDSISEALKAVGCRDVSKEHLEKIAEANNIKPYTGSAFQHMKMMVLIKSGKLKKA